MYKFLLAAILTLAAFPAIAADDDASIQQQKQEILKNSKQETIALGNNRFLLFSGTKSPFQYAYSIDLIKTEGGVPKMEPLFMEEYDIDSKKFTLSEGVGFAAQYYHFDVASGRLDYTARDIDEKTRFAYKYRLAGDTLKLLEIATQDTGDCTDASCKNAPPEIIFKAEEKHAQTH